MTTVSIVIPVYNSAKTIGLVADQLHKSLNNYSLQLILANDSSRDESWEILKGIYDKYPKTICIDQSKNFGQHNTILNALRYATGDYCIVMDDDLQTSPTDTLTILQTLEQEDFDVVYAQYGSKKHSAWRNIGTWINNSMASYFIGKPKELSITSFFGFKKFITSELTRYHGSYTYLPGLIFRSTSHIGTVSVTHNSREHGESNYTLRKLIALWLSGFINFSVRPLRVLSVLGFLLATFAVLYVGFVLIHNLVNPAAPLGWSSLIIVTALFGGTNLMGIGLLGEYLGRMYLNSNNQPQVVVREILK